MKAGDLTQDQAADYIADFVINPSKMLLKKLTMQLTMLRFKQITK